MDGMVSVTDTTEAPSLNDDVISMADTADVDDSEPPPLEPLHPTLPGLVQEGEPGGYIWRR